jgi:hypothetical protein
MRVENMLVLAAVGVVGSYKIFILPGDGIYCQAINSSATRLYIWFGRKLRSCRAVINPPNLLANYSNVLFLAFSGVLLYQRSDAGPVLLKTTSFWSNTDQIKASYH